MASHCGGLKEEKPKRRCIRVSDASQPARRHSVNRTRITSSAASLETGRALAERAKRAMREAVSARRLPDVSRRRYSELQWRKFAEEARRTRITLLAQSAHLRQSAPRASAK